MRVMVGLMILVAIVATVFGLFPSVRSKAEDVLFGPETAKKAAAEESEDEESVVAAAAVKAGNGLKKVLVAAKEAVTDAGPTRAAPPGQNATAAPAPSPPQAGQQPAPSAAPATPIALPPALSGARFGMTSSQVQAAHSAGWHRQQGGEEMFAHYPVPDKSQVFRFHFANDSLYLIEVQFKQIEGQTLKELYDYYRESLAQTYRNAPEAGATGWSDGTIDVHIRMDKAKNLVLISYICPSAKG